LKRVPFPVWVGLAVVLAGGGAAAWYFTSKADPAEGANGGETPTPAVRPNVLLVSLDTLRADRLGCYGYARGTSPNLDRLAAEGVVFTNCQAQAPWTLPSHMSLFTSLLPTHNGVDSLNKVLPPNVKTLTEVLRGAGYRTAALVNNGQMRAHWGFNRGFQTWREFEVDTPAGACENLTAEAVKWLKHDGEAPFFLFLHYYDTHDPYEAPAEYRKRFGTTLTGAQARKLCFRNRTPALNLGGPLLDDLMAAYDAEVAWLDHELGKLLAAVPANTLVVVFSDHGEAFEEHGWTLHGATLYEEELRVPLLLRLPGASPKERVISDPVMLLDVAPTVLAACGLPPQEQFRGTDLGPLWEGRRAPARLIQAETKAVLEGRYLLSITAHPLKGIYSLFDGRFELYRLPDEHRDLSKTDREAAAVLRKAVREWAEGEQFWMIHAVGAGDYEAEIKLGEGGLGLFIPVGLDPERDDLEVVEDGRALRWHVYPGGGVKSLFLQPEKADTPLTLSLRINGAEAADKVYLGKKGRGPERLPVTVAADLDPSSPFIERPFAADREGFHVLRHRSPRARQQPWQVRPLDDATLRHLRTLGYVR
jgi:arylsulfatase A-like enzyme